MIPTPLPCLPGGNTFVAFPVVSPMSTVVTIVSTFVTFPVRPFSSILTIDISVSAVRRLRTRAG